MSYSQPTQTTGASRSPAPSSSPNPAISPGMNNQISSFTGSNASTSIQISLSDSQESMLLLYASRAQEQLNNQFSIRSAFEDIDKAYMREQDQTREQWRARNANAKGDSDKFQNITVPIVMPQVQAAMGYLTNVFLTGSPIFAVNADPGMQDAAEQIETIIAENSSTAGWSRHLLMFFRDGLKYNWHGIEVNWEQQVAAQITTDPTTATGSRPKRVLWNGNVIRRMDPYNTFFDIRVHPSEHYLKGEYAGYIEMLSRTGLKQYLNALTTVVDKKTITRALQSSYGGGVVASGSTPFAYYVPDINPAPTMPNVSSRGFDWMSWATVGSNAKQAGNYGNIYTKTTMYARILPDDFNLSVPGKNTPQVWKLVIINGQVIVEFYRLTNAHDHIPIYFGQPLEDGLDFQTKSFATNVVPMQQVASAMMNGYVASKRRLVGDRVLYDPLRVTAKDINSTNPAAKIPVRPAAFGKPVSEAVYAFPYRDDATASFTQAADMAIRFSNMINGQNPAQQGQFVKGNKTLHEYEDVMGHGNAVNQMMAIAIEQQVFTPVKEVLKLNILQYQQPAVIINPNTRNPVTIDPVTLRNTAVQFKMSDGLVPADKTMNTEELTTALQVLGSSPQIASQYTMGPLFTYIMKLRGADLKPFEKTPQQIQYEQQMMQWQQMAQLALEKGGTFNTPQPQPPPPAQPTPTPTSVALASTQGTSNTTPPTNA